jgi:hypothetical protein
MDVYIVTHTPKQPLLQDTGEGADMASEQSDAESDVDEVLDATPAVYLPDESSYMKQDDGDEVDPADIEDPRIIGPRGFDRLPAERIAQLSAYPAARLDLTYADGYGGQTARGNVHLARGGDMVYPTGGVCVVHNRTTNTQRIFQKHTRRITSTAVHVQGEMVATGDLGPDPVVLVWHMQTLQLVAQFPGLQPLMKVKQKDASSRATTVVPTQIGCIAALSFAASDTLVSLRCYDMPKNVNYSS